jgi:hypothetical protein
LAFASPGIGNIVSTGHDPIDVVNPKDYGGQVDDETPVVVAYNLTHYESLHPSADIEETIKLTNSHIAQPSRYTAEYGFTTNDISYLVLPTAPSPNKKIEQIPEVFLDDTETEKEFQSIIPENHTMGDKFVFIQGDIRFEEEEQENVKCGGCKKSVRRICGHLSNNTECAEKDLPELKSVWQKFTKRRKNTKYESKKKMENTQGFFKEK